MAQGRIPAALVPLAPGRDGVAQTLRLMAGLVRSTGGRASVTVRQLALSIVGELPEKSHAAEVRALHAWVRDRIRYVRDVRGVETVQTPERTIANGQGDCDDKSLLLAALLESVGYRTRFEAVGFAPGRLSHVLPSVQFAGQWVALECTLPVPMGWFPPGVRAALTHEV